MAYNSSKRDSHRRDKPTTIEATRETIDRKRMDYLSIPRRDSQTSQKIQSLSI
ncbi:MAG: hypothetical protein AB1502_01825 [Thermodesulfobacteriota bacterium]